MSAADPFAGLLGPQYIPNTPDPTARRHLIAEDSAKHAQASKKKQQPNLERRVKVGADRKPHGVAYLGFVARVKQSNCSVHQVAREMRIHVTTAYKIAHLAVSLGLLRWSDDVGNIGRPGIKPRLLEFVK